MIGNNIKRLRTQRGMTQKNLADRLFVSPQAVSRWENNEVEPSLGTVIELAKIFQVTTDEILNDDYIPPEPETVERVVEKVVEKKEYVYKEPPPQILGVCRSCRKPITNPAEMVGQTIGSDVTCSKCRRQKEEDFKRELRVLAETRRKRSFIWGGVAAGAWFLLILFAAIYTSYWPLLWGLLATPAVFTLVSCLILRNNFVGVAVLVVLSVGFVKLPGLIFTFDIDGCLWFIAMKILFWILGIFLAVAGAALALTFGMILSVFVYPYALNKNIRRPEECNDAESHRF